MEHLISLGHRDIGLVGANQKSPPSVLERKQAFLQVLVEHGLPTHHTEESHLTEASGFSATRALLRRAPEITAIFAASDVAALGVLKAARSLEIRVPEMLSVIGFDNIDMASVVTPTLATVHVHKTWLGALGVRQLVQRAKEPRHPKVTISVTTRLVPRDSVGPCLAPDRNRYSEDMRPSLETVKGGV